MTRTRTLGKCTQTVSILFVLSCFKRKEWFNYPLSKRTTDFLYIYVTTTRLWISIPWRCLVGWDLGFCAFLNLFECLELHKPLAYWVSDLILQRLCQCRTMFTPGKQWWCVSPAQNINWPWSTGFICLCSIEIMVLFSVQGHLGSSNMRVCALRFTVLKSITYKQK